MSSKDKANDNRLGDIGNNVTIIQGKLAAGKVLADIFIEELPRVYYTRLVDALRIASAISLIREECWSVVSPPCEELTDVKWCVVSPLYTGG